MRKNLALKNHIAIWDVLQACVREGSLDNAIEQEVPNDFRNFLETHPNIKFIVFNGQKAAKYFNQYVTVSNQYKLVTLPSTSPANAGISFEQKLKILSPRELQVFNLLALGLNNNELMDNLKISLPTVKQYKSEVMYKLRLRSVAELIAMKLDSE
jgi:DNA-binding CsgD family transcriptional regulator